MEIFTTVVLVLLLVATSSFRVFSFYYEHLNIDCGASVRSIDEATQYYWDIDEEFVQSGQIQFVPISNDSIPYQMQTLRSFPVGNRNCYNLSFKAQTKFLVRAGFYYGNYDGLLKPPTFVVEVDHKLNATVDTSLSGDDPLYIELIFFPEKETGDVCLVRTQFDDVPFISTLEITSLFHNPELYSLMQNHTALYLETRVNYGANKTVPQQFPYPYNRLWKPEEVLGYRTLAPDHDVVTSSTYAWTENYPPLAVLHCAIEAYNTSQSIVLPVTFHDKSQQNISAYFVFYFATFEGNFSMPNRTVAIYIDGEEKSAIEIPPWYNSSYPVVSVCPVNVKSGAANVTIAAAQGSKLPPLLSAMEVYSTMSEVITNVSHDTSESREFYFSHVSLASTLFCFLIVLCLA